MNVHALETISLFDWNSSFDLSMSAEVEAPRPRDVGRVSYSSSPGLSSPPSPHSPPHAISHSRSGTQFQSVLPSQHVHLEMKVDGEKATKLALAKNTVPKKPRQKRELHSKTENASKSSTATDGKDPAAKVRKPRAPSGASSTTARKKKPVMSKDFVTEVNVSRQWTLGDNAQISPTFEYKIAAKQPLPRNGNDEAIANSNPPYAYLSTTPRTAPRSSSGQNYDPIRSATIEHRAIAPQSSYKAPIRSSSPPRPSTNYSNSNPSPSIAIASLIEKPSNQAYNFPKPPKRNSDVHAPTSATKRTRLSPPPAVDSHVEPVKTSRPMDSLPTNRQAPNGYSTMPMDIDVDMAGQGSGNAMTAVRQSAAAAAAIASTGASSRTHSPKPSRQKEPPVAPPPGNGLLSSAIFGGALDNPTPGKTAPTVILHVSLEGCNHKYVNFARMAEERYGFNALHPRLAAQRERLARVAAAGAAIELAHKGTRNSGSGLSADELSLDLSENEGGGDDSNIEMGGLHEVTRSGGEGSEATLVKKTPKKRLMKEDYYDKDDPFVDDTELAWEEQAAASKDGFFVYSGPLVPEGEKANIERYTCLPLFPSSSVTYGLY